MRTAIALVLGTLLAGIVACGGAKSSGMAPASMHVGNAPHHDEIADLDQKIDAAAANMQLARPAVVTPPCAPGQCGATPMSAQNPTVAEDPSCKAAETDTCKTSCTFADSICTNADKICKIAGQLQNDAWANDKCTGGTATCKAAHDKCCGCM